jgi:hypothetical protein
VGRLFGLWLAASMLNRMTRINRRPVARSGTNGYPPPQRIPDDDRTRAGGSREHDADGPGVAPTFKPSCPSQLAYLSPGDGTGPQTASERNLP